MADIGYFALILALVMSAYALTSYILGLKLNRQDFLASATGGVLGAALFTSVAGLSLIYLLMSSDFSIEYVAMYTSTDLPVFYKFSALWAGNNGSLLLWVWVLTLIAAIAVTGKKNRDLMPYAGSVMMVVSIFFLFLLAYNSNPFAKLPGPLPEGNGLNPMLQNPGMVFHPLTLYLGYVGFTVPFAFAIAALITRQVDDRWIKFTRKWTIISWLFLSLGNLFGAQWAYVELGWGGYWAWDPVENASLMPWLTGSAFLHSVMIQERKNMLKIWNMLLIIITFGLTLFGTFLVRSGVVASVHAFGDSSLGMFFLVFTTLVITGSLYLVADRLKLLNQGNEFEGIISKESSFLLNNLLLVGSAFTVFWGTVFPIVSEAFTGKKVTVGAPFFNSVNAPLGLAFVLLMGICPLIAWRKATIKNLLGNFVFPVASALVTAVILVLAGITKPYAVVAFSICLFVTAAILQDVFKGVVVRRKLTGESWGLSMVRLLTRNRRRYGGYIIHLGIVMMIVGIAGSNIYNQEVTTTLKPGQSAQVAGYSFSYNGLQQTTKRNTTIVFADVNVSKNGQSTFQIRPEKVFYPTTEQPSTEPAINSSWLEDFYLVIAGWEQDQSATFKVNINPLVKWLWTGGYVLIFGTIFALWPGKGSGVGTKYLGRS
ncbi:MAG: heme lyase CcmF/NrfE family subunit [Clostridia bacterium]|nr:heme lyase CcmF/NrfE family subunit [Clostridia bacterium]